MTGAAAGPVAEAALPGAEPAGGRVVRPRWRWRRSARRAVLFLLGMALAGAAWEGYKAVGSPDGGSVSGVRVLPRADDDSMPHLVDILRRFGRPETAGTGSHSVAAAVADGVWFTFRVAMAGFALGVLVGLLLAVLMQRFRLAERGLLPYVVLSQTVPLVALAPLVVGWGGRLHLGSLTWRPWMSVAVIAAYLAFFPVAVGALRGLQSPAGHAVELMRSYSASWWQALTRLRLPAAVPYLVPALRLGAASAVVGAIVAEISTGTRGGIGRLIIEYSREATADPAKVYTAFAGAAALGLAVAGLVALLDLGLSRYQPAEEAR
ncbi:MAG TPA: ABC transporter permease subunit [Mycobacteriales bacterium]|nr:ABC transporter permease subunit [Mycobacteriales bacterium]